MFIDKLLNGYLSVQPFMDGEGDVGGGAPTTVNTPAATETPGNSAQPNSTALEFEIEGVGKVKADEIKEWKMGYMRQSDYTRKTQEIAKQRSEVKDAMDLYNYFKNNPQIAQAVANGDMTALQNSPVAAKLTGDPKVDALAMEVANMKLDQQISALKQRYNDFDEVAVLTEADKRGVADLEFIYKALKADKPAVDEKALREQIMKELRSQLTDEIRKNGLATSTIITTGDTPANDGKFGLSEAELAICNKMGISPEKYAQRKQT